jgi:hypothetical protein
LWWIYAANNYGFIPWLGMFMDDISSSEAAEISTLVNQGKATAAIHAFSYNDFFYFDHNSISNFSDETISANYATALQWFNTHSIPISKYVAPHFYEIGSNAFAGLQNWGTQFIGTMMDPGQGVFGGTDWLMRGPYRLYETGSADDFTQNPYYSDYISIPGHSEMEGKFFNCVTEVRDITGYEWLGYGRLGVPEAIADGTQWLKRSFDSMVLATLFSHENIFVSQISQGDWQAYLQGITTNIASYQPIYVSLDYGCQYARAVYTSNIQASQYNPEQHQVTVTLAGQADIATKFYLFTETAAGIQQALVDAPAFTGSTQVTYTIPGPLDHIIISPNPGSVIAGATIQFTAQGYDANNLQIPNLQFNWQVVNDGGSINVNGLFTAGAVPGTYVDTVAASLGGVEGRATVQVSATTLDHFKFDTIASPVYAGIPFQVTIRAMNSNEIPVVTYTGTARLSDSTGTIQPAQTGSFVNGVWTGNITIAQVQNGVVIYASDGAADGVSNAFDVEQSPVCPCTIWPASATPSVLADPDTSAIELGVKFQSDVEGLITGIRFYKSASNTGTHTGSLWARSGQLLATATFTNESASGWQQVVFTSPVLINADTPYVASYHTDVGRYSIDDGYFSSEGVAAPPLRALADSVDGGNGVYKYGSSGFPSDSFHASNYWVDVVFETPSSSVCQDVSVTTGWNLVSVPLQAADMRLTTLFPDITPPAYFYTSAYQEVLGSDLLVTGRGYWMSFTAPHTYQVCGQVVSPKDIPVNAGWNMIGPFDAAVPVSAITSTPSGILTPPVYAYNGAYLEAVSLDPGKAYWAFASLDGTLHLGAAGALAAPLPEPASIRLNLPQDFRLPLQVSSGDSRISLQLGLTPLASDGYDAALDRLAPPPAPAGAFNAFFSLDGLSYLTDLRSPGETEYSFNLRLTPAGSSEIRLSWDAAALSRLGEFTILDPFTRRLFILDMSSTDKLVITPNSILSNGLVIDFRPAVPSFPIFLPLVSH